MKRIGILLTLVVLSVGLIAPLNGTAKMSRTVNRDLHQHPTTGKVGGSAWYHSGNLLQNPDASALTVNPWIGTGTWTVTTGPVLLGPLSIDSSDGSPWFLESGGVSVLNACSACFNSRTVTLSQTVNLSSYFLLIQNSSIYFVYGGDAFAEGMKFSGSGVFGYLVSNGYEASYRLDFLNSSGGPLAWDASGPIFNSNFACASGTSAAKNYGYRRTVTAIPKATRSIRFTATMMDTMTVCHNVSTTSTFRNGFDNLWLEFVFDKRHARESVNGRFVPGSPPGSFVKATLMPNAKANRQ
jgi:hypothetical protein